MNINKWLAENAEYLCQISACGQKAGDEILAVPVKKLIPILEQINEQIRRDISERKHRRALPRAILHHNKPEDSGNLPDVS
jgi:hypothetical protein